MGALATAQNLTELARSRTPADRERLMLALADLCEQGGDASRAPETQALMGQIFLELVNGAAHDIRLALAEKLAKADWPPTALVEALARDEIDVAKPVIAESPLLDEPALLRLLGAANVDHQIEVAQRPGIGEGVVETILSQAEPTVLTALAGNDTAEISPQAMVRLVEASRQIAAMRSPLARHPRLTTELAERLYLWVGQSLRAAIVSRFRVDVAALDRAVAEAVDEAQHAGPSGEERQDMERRLVAKLYAAGQLRPSYLMRALREQRLSLFITALAALGGFAVDQVRAAVAADSPEPLALACIGVGVDRGAFNTLLGLVRGLADGQPGGDPELARRTFARFAGDQQGKAAAAFRGRAGAI